MKWEKGGGLKARKKNKRYTTSKRVKNHGCCKSKRSKKLEERRRNGRLEISSREGR